MVVGRFFLVILGLNPEQGPGLETVHSPIDKLFVRVNFLQGIGLVWFGCANCSRPVARLWVDNSRLQIYFFIYKGCFVTVA